jgi:hypothetical protein
MTPHTIAQLLSITPPIEFLLSFVFLYLVDTPNFFLSMFAAFFTFPAMLIFYIGLYFFLNWVYRPDSWMPVYIIGFFAVSYTFYIIKYMIYYQKIKITFSNALPAAKEAALSAASKVTSSATTSSTPSSSSLLKKA